MSIHLSNFAHVQNYVAKADQSPGTKTAGISSLFRAVSGLALIENKKYKQAALKFVECDYGARHDLLDGGIIVAQDIGIHPLF